MGKLTKYLLAVVFVIAVHPLFAQYYACSDGEWSTMTWYQSDCTTPQAGPPGQWDEVFIQSGVTVTVTGDLLAADHSGILNLDGTLDITGAFERGGGNNFIMGASSVLTVGGSATIPTPLTTGDGASITVGSTFTTSGTTTFGTNNIITASSIATSGFTTDDGTTVTVSNSLTATGSVTFGSNNTVEITANLTSAALTVNAGTELRIEGSYSHTGTLDVYGTMIVEGNFTDTNQTVNVYAGGELIVKGDVTDNSTFTIAGTMLVSGDFSKTSGGTLTVSSGGFLAVGGDYTITGTTTQVEGDMTVLGDYSSDNQTNGAGEITVVGDVTLGSGTNTPDATIETTDPIWTSAEGVRQIYWEDFTGKTGTTIYPDDGYSNWEILETTLASVTGTDEGLAATFSNNRPANYYIWETDGVEIGCYTNLIVSGYVTGALKDNINLQYSLYISGSWQNWNNVGEVDAATGWRKVEVATTASMVRLRINANSIEGPGSINVDNISISGTIGLGPELPSIELDVNYAEMAVCTGQTSVYRLSEEFATYTWTVSDAGSNTLTNGSTSSPTVVWSTLPATLYVTVTSECGRTGSESWEITNDNSFKVVLLDNVDPSCFGDADGSITVGAYCGSANLEYSIDTDPVQTNTTGIFSSLEGGTYTITANDLDNSYTDNLTIDLVPPAEIEITLLPTSSTFSCNGDFGCSGILDFSISGGTGLLVPTLSGEADDNPGVTLQIDPVIELVMTSSYSLTDYPLIVRVDKATYPEVYPDFSDVRFFADADLTVPLYYWMDPAYYTYDTEATFYVKTDVSDGGSIYMYYGNATAYPATSSFTEVLTEGGMALEYFTTTGWSGSSTGCTDSETAMDYTSGTFSDCTLSLSATDQSFKWSGWIAVPPASQGDSYLKVYTGKDKDDPGAVQMYLNGGDIGYGNKYVDISAYYDELVYLEIWYSKSSTNDQTFEVAWSNNNGNSIGGGDTYLDPSSALSRYSVNPEPTVTPVLSARYTGLCAGTYNLTVTDNGGTGCSVTTEDILIEVDNDAVTFETSSLPGDYSDDQLNHATTVDGQTLYYNNFSSPVASYTTTGSFTSEMYKIKHDGNGTGTLTIETSTKGFTSIDISFIAYQSVGGDPGWASTDYLQIAYEYDDGTGTWVDDGDVPVLDDTGIWSGEDGIPGTQFINNGNTVGSEFTYTFADGHGIEDRDNIRIIITVYSGSTDRNYYFDEITITGATNYSVDPSVSGEPTVLEAGVAGTITPYYIDQVVANATCGGSILITRTWNAVDNCGTYATPYVQNITLYDNSVGPSLVLGAANEPSTNYSFCENEVTLTVPVAGANICEDYTVYYKIDGGTAVDVYTGDLASQPTTSTITYTFPVGTTTTFTWGVIDPVLATFEEDYSVTVSDELDATFTYNPDPPGFCVGGSATVTATPSGGIGPYTYVFATVDDRITGTAGSGASGQWTTDQFADGDQVKVEITDSRGCDTNDNTVPGDIADTQAFTVYPNVVTPAISN